VRGIVYQIGVEGQKEVQWGSWAVRKIIQKNNRITGNLTIELVLNDEGINRQRIEMPLREKEKGKRKRWSHC
jgi:hypothetical protein